MIKFLCTKEYTFLDISAYFTIFTLSQVSLWFFFLIIPYAIVAVTIERKVND
jgi:hypothetical protein